MEVSIGNYGNVNEKDVAPGSSVTVATSPISDGSNYWFGVLAPWCVCEHVVIIATRPSFAANTTHLDNRDALHIVLFKTHDYDHMAHAHTRAHIHACKTHSAMVLMLRKAASRAPVVIKVRDLLTRRRGETSTACEAGVRIMAGE